MVQNYSIVKKDNAVAHVCVEIGGFLGVGGLKPFVMRQWPN